MPDRADQTPEPLLSVRGLRVSFPGRSRGLLGRRGGRIEAVRGVSFEIAPGRTLGLVGESGCGKSTTGRALLRLIEPRHGVEVSGSATFDGTDLFAASPAELRALRRQIQVIFQDPGGSLNPRHRIAEIVSEPLAIHGLARSGKARRDAAAELLDRCGMPPSAADRYPHEFSGGQRQRIAIARALALKPALIICDEPTSALDVSVQAQILNLLKDLQRDAGLAYLFISHDMAVINHMCDHIAVMRAGEIVEQGERDGVLTKPREPYTRDLLAAVPTISVGRASA